MVWNPIGRQPGLQSEFILVNKMKSSNAMQTPRHQWHLMEAYKIFKIEESARFCNFLCQVFSQICLCEVPGTGTMLCQRWKTGLSRPPNFGIPFCTSRYHKSCSLMSCSPRDHRFLDTILGSKELPMTEILHKMCTALGRPASSSQVSQRRAQPILPAGFANEPRIEDCPPLLQNLQHQWHVIITR
jgi:hypothetical protein